MAPKISGTMFHIDCPHFLISLVCGVGSHYAKKCECSTFRQNAFEALFASCLTSLLQVVIIIFKKPECERIHGRCLLIEDVY